MLFKPHIQLFKGQWFVRSINRVPLGWDTFERACRDARFIWNLN